MGGFVADTNYNIQLLPLNEFATIQNTPKNILGSLEGL